MHEQQLRRNAWDLIGLVGLEREIPERKLVVGRHTEHRRVVRRPLHRRDGRLQIVEAAHEAAATRAAAPAGLLEIANIPHAEGAVVGAGDHQIADLPIAQRGATDPLVPVEHVHVAVVRLHRQHAAPRGVARVPDAHRAVHRAGREHRALRRAPLQVLHRRRVVAERRRVRRPAALHRRGDVDQARAVARRQQALLARRPVQRVALRAVPAELVDRIGGK